MPNSVYEPILGSLHRRAEADCARRVANALTTDDLWQLMRRRVPPVVSEYFRGAADDEITNIENVLAFRQARTTAWGAQKFDSLDLRTSAGGQKLDVPFFVAPVGSLRALWPKADALGARAAGELGTAMTLSTVSGTPMEEVRAATRGPCWFQLYLCGGRDVALRGIARAKKAGFDALMLTIDTGQSGNRVAHARMKPMQAAAPLRGCAADDRLAIFRTKTKLIPQMLPRLSWLASHWNDGGLMQFVNVEVDESGTPMPYADIAAQLAASAVTWEDLSWIKEAWGDKPLFIKGVHNADDAKRAADAGASAVIWSNHGGRQLDGVPAALHIVSDEMPKVQHLGIDFMMDGGIRRGRDILIALSYGLKAVGLGRVAVAGLGAGGYAGITRAFQIMTSELKGAMTLLGVKSIEEVRARGSELRRENRIIGNDHLREIVF